MIIPGPLALLKTTPDEIRALVKRYGMEPKPVIHFDESTFAPPPPPRHYGHRPTGYRAPTNEAPKRRQ